MPKGTSLRMVAPQPYNREEIYLEDQVSIRNY